MRREAAKAINAKTAIPMPAKSTRRFELRAAACGLDTEADMIIHRGRNKELKRAFATRQSPTGGVIAGEVRTKARADPHYGRVKSAPKIKSRGHEAQDGCAAKATLQSQGHAPNTATDPDPSGRLAEPEAGWPRNKRFPFQPPAPLWGERIRIWPRDIHDSLAAADWIRRDWPLPEGRQNPHEDSRPGRGHAPCSGNASRTNKVRSLVLGGSERTGWARGIRSSRTPSVRLWRKQADKRTTRAFFI